MKRIKCIICVMVVSLLSVGCFYAEAFAASEKNCYSQEEIVEYLRQCAVERQEKIVVKYSSDSILSEDDLRRITEEVFGEETDSPKEGDYLAYQYGSYDCSCSGTYAYGKYEHTITYTYDYYTTKEQEEMVDKKVDKVLKDLEITEDMSDYTKASLIYEYICDHVKYSKGADDSNLNATAYSALINGKAICQGYANLFYRLAEEAGLDARIISGKSNDEAHAWNIVKIKEKYYYVDATWDAGKSGYGYFLKGREAFERDHTPKKEYKTKEFVKEYDIDQKDYIQSKSELFDKWLTKMKIWKKNFGVFLEKYLIVLYN